MALQFNRVVKFLEVYFPGPASGWTSGVIRVPGSDCPCCTLYTPQADSDTVVITRFDGKILVLQPLTESQPGIVQICEDIISFNSEKPF